MDSKTTEVFDYETKCKLKSVCEELCYNTLQLFEKTYEHPYIKPLGTGVLVQIEHDYFIFTAGHVAKDHDIYIPNGDYQILLVGGYIIGEYNGNIDYAVIRLEDNVADIIKAKNYRFIELDDIGASFNADSEKKFQVVGYPASRSKYNRKSKCINCIPYLYITKSADSKIYDRLNYNSDTHIIVHYEKNNTAELITNKKNTGPDGYGISGGGLWYTTLTNEDVPKSILVGIIIEWPVKDRRFWVAIKVDYFLNIIKYGLV